MASPLLPPAPRWVQVLTFSLVGVFVLELLLRAVHVPVDLLAWWPMGKGFAPWQPATRLLIQGADSSAVFRTVFGAFILYISLGALDRRAVAQALLAAWACGTALALGLDALGLLSPSLALGWTGLIGPIFVLFGLYHPDGKILLGLVLPITGRLLVWGTLFVCALVFLAEQTLGAADAIGGWLGVVGWWWLFGPGARTRSGRRVGRTLRTDHGHFKVIDGGRANDHDNGQVH